VEEGDCSEAGVEATPRARVMRARDRSRLDTVVPAIQLLRDRRCTNESQTTSPDGRPLGQKKGVPTTK